MTTAAAAGRRPRLRVRSELIDDPGDLLELLPFPDALAWVRGGEGLVGWGAMAVDAGGGAPRLAEMTGAVTALLSSALVDDEVGVPGSGPVAFVSAPFDPDAGGTLAVIPRVVLGRRAGLAWRTVVDADGEPKPAHGDGAPGRPSGLPAEPPGRIRYAGSSLSEVAWLEAVDAAIRAIRQGTLDKVVLARDLRVWAERPLDPRELVRRLADRFPGCYTFSSSGLVGATPELLVARSGEDVTSLVLAGSAARGRDPVADAAAGSALLGSGKDRSEHGLAVASVTDVLAGMASDLQVEPVPSLLRLANVQHLATAVRGRLRGSGSALDLAAALHPTAAVCGTPTATALGVIRRLEQLERGRYAGPVGWVDGRGDGELGIALRCAEVSGSRARLFAGAGVVADSLPEAELEETRLKLGAMQSALEHDL